jgi:hypothetical protein
MLRSYTWTQRKEGSFLKPPERTSSRRLFTSYIATCETYLVVVAAVSKPHSFRWKVKLKSIIRWFVVREKCCTMPNKFKRRNEVISLFCKVLSSSLAGLSLSRPLHLPICRPDAEMRDGGPWIHPCPVAHWICGSCGKCKLAKQDLDWPGRHVCTFLWCENVDKLTRGEDWWWTRFHTHACLFQPASLVG